MNTVPDTDKTTEDFRAEGRAALLGQVEYLIDIAGIVARMDAFTRETVAECLEFVVGGPIRLDRTSKRRAVKALKPLMDGAVFDAIIARYKRP